MNTVVAGHFSSKIIQSIILASLEHFKYLMYPSRSVTDLSNLCVRCLTIQYVSMIELCMLMVVLLHAHSLSRFTFSSLHK